MVTEIIYIDDHVWRSIELEKLDPAEKISKRKFVTAEEYLNRPKLCRRVTVDMSEGMRRTEEHRRKVKALSDSLQRRYRQKQDSIRRQDSIKQLNSTR